LREVELKLRVDGALDVARAAERCALFPHERTVRTLVATYYDTDDLRLARWGATLRFRTGDEGPGKWTLKLPEADDGSSARAELDFPGGPRKIPDEARRLLVAFVRSAALARVARLRTVRRSWALTRDGGEVAELVDDEVAILDGRTIAGRFREVEIEARAATLREIEAIAEALKDGGAIAGEQMPKLARALGPRAEAPPDVAVPEPVAPKDPAAAAVRAALLDGARRILRNHAGVVLGDAEAVHQMRVGARRIRSDLGTFAPLVEEEPATRLTNELAWLAAALGEVRDLDVLDARLRGHAPVADDLEPLFGRLRESRDARRAELIEVLGSARYVALLDDLVRAAAQPPLTEAAADPCREALPPLVAKAWSSLAKTGRLLAEGDPEEDWHRVRKKAKRARYAAEAAARCLGSAGKEAREFASLCEAVQEVLGEHQDAVVARDEVIAAVKEIEGSPAFHFGAGRLAEVEDGAARAARGAFPRTWDALDRKKRRRWLS
jgi:CHAD domain-containing protein